MQHYVSYEHVRELDGKIKVRALHKFKHFSTQTWRLHHPEKYSPHSPVKRAISSLRAAAEVDAESIVSEVQVRVGNEGEGEGQELRVLRLSC